MLSEAERSRNISEFQIKVRDSSTSLEMTKGVIASSSGCYLGIEQFDRFVDEGIVLE
jgi:hypothetical protein